MLFGNSASLTVDCCIARAPLLRSLEMSEDFSYESTTRKIKMVNEQQRKSPRFDITTGKLVHEQQRECLIFDSRTGKLVNGKHQNYDHDAVCATTFQYGFFGGNCAIRHPQQDEMRILSHSPDGEPVRVKTIHISCESDTFQGEESNYAGVIIYQYHGRSEWRTRNGKHCKAGYLVIQDTDSEEVKQWTGKTDGVVHGAVYRNAFGEDVDTSKVIGEGFSIMKGKFKINSGVFNNPSESEYHDGRRQMSELSEHCVGKVVESWKKAGPTTFGCRNFTIKELFKGYMHAV